ncbi:MAG: BamA/TamA family outer membrane protein [Cyanobacteria bacterium]|nr:BamA/TamA family outer membrane protein [Cyanobacteriota bacterium]MDW8201164.1 BamA/TamA family outer membrane protein [Cyanobacteriota bacterium SKYGB_h_bin112]
MRFSSSLFLPLVGILPVLAFGNVVNAQALYYPVEDTKGQPSQPAGSALPSPAPLTSESMVLSTGLTGKAATVSNLLVSGVIPVVAQPSLTVQPAFSTAQTPTSPQGSEAPVITPPVRPQPGVENVPTQETPNRIDFNQGPPPPTLDAQPPVPEQPPAEPVNPAPPPTLPVPSAPSTTVEPRVLVAEILVSGTDDMELQTAVYNAVRIRPGRTTTQSELQQDVNAVFATGFFSRVGVTPEDTPLGVRITFVVTPNPVLTRVVIPDRAIVDGKPVLPDEVIDKIFSPQYGKILNLRTFQNSVQELNKWYQDNGYVLAQVVEAPQVAEDGTVTLAVAEGVIEDIKVQFLTKDGSPTDDNGQPIRGRTREFIITREFSLKPGSVFQRSQAEADLERVFRLGIFDDVRLSFSPGSDPRKLIVIANVVERSTGSVAAGAGISSASGIFGTISYQEQNFGGNNQKFGAEFQLGEREQLFDISFTDPWIGGDPLRTSYSVNVFNRRSISLVFDGGRQEVRLPNGDVPRIDRLGAGFSFSRPLGGGWTGSVGFQYQLVSTRDFNRNIVGNDQFGNPLTFSRSGVDDLYSFQLGFARDQRNDPLRPTSGSLLRLGMEQTVPLGSGNIFYNRVRGSYSFYVPVQFLNFNPNEPQALAFNVQAGTVLGDLPPYEAFALGGVNSVRGYEEGGLGSGRSFVQATAEYRFPLISIVGGALFVDVASDLGTASSVLGNPAGIRQKPGSGFGYGLGLRVQTPLGPLRIDYGINDLGNSRIHFGIGERF